MHRTAQIALRSAHDQMPVRLHPGIGGDLDLVLLDRLAQQLQQVLAVPIISKRSSSSWQGWVVRRVGIPLCEHQFLLPNRLSPVRKIVKTDIREFLRFKFVQPSPVCPAAVDHVLGLEVRKQGEDFEHTVLVAL